MLSKPFILRTVAAAALVCVAGASQAALTLYTTQASFLAAVSSPGVDTYTGFSISGTTPSPVTRMAGSYSYTATVFGDFFGAGTSVDPWLATNTATEAITFSAFSGGASAVGGNFFGSDIAGKFLTGSITLTATDSLGATSSVTLANATTESFRGFLSTGTLTSLVVETVQPAAFYVWPTVDNLTIAVAVPEPETYALLLAGLALVGAAARRRRG